MQSIYPKHECKIIANYYDMQHWKIGETYRFRISNIYDPSKFWIVVKDRELDKLQLYLKEFYTKNGSKYTIPSNEIKKDLYCLVFSDDGYYRCRIVCAPYLKYIEQKVVVYLIDFGYITLVPINQIFFLQKELFDVPQFAVRATLAGVQSTDVVFWKYEAIKRFGELVSGKILLCILENTDPTRKIVEIRIGDVDEFLFVRKISDILIKDNLAEIVKKPDRTEKIKKGRYTYKTCFSYLFPTFEAIEGGILPSDVHTIEALRYYSNDILLKPYLKYSNVIVEKIPPSTPFSSRH